VRVIAGRHSTCSRDVPPPRPEDRRPMPKVADLPVGPVVASRPGRTPVPPPRRRGRAACGSAAAGVPHQLEAPSLPSFLLTARAGPDPAAKADRCGASDIVTSSTGGGRRYRLPTLGGRAGRDRSVRARLCVDRAGAARCRAREARRPTVAELAPTWSLHSPARTEMPCRVRSGPARTAAGWWSSSVRAGAAPAQRRPTEVLERRSQRQRPPPPCASRSTAGRPGAHRRPIRPQASTARYAHACGSAGRPRYGSPPGRARPGRPRPEAPPPGPGPVLKRPSARLLSL
jgi:hypothetical protein